VNFHIYSHFYMKLYIFSESIMQPKITERELTVLYIQDPHQGFR